MRCTKTWRFTAVGSAMLAVLAATATIGVRPAAAQESSSSEQLKQELDQARRQNVELKAKLDRIQAAEGKRSQQGEPQAKWQQLRRLQEELWETQYKPQITVVNGREVNRHEVEMRFKDALARALGSFNGGQPRSVTGPAGAPPSSQSSRGMPSASGEAAQRFDPALAMHAQPDLVTLGTQLLESEAQRQVSTLELERYKRLAAEKAVSNEELQRAVIQADMANRKARMLRMMAETALKSAVQNLETVKNLVEMGRATSSQLSEIQQRVETLKIVLSAGQ